MYALIIFVGILLAHMLLVERGLLYVIPSKKHRHKYISRMLNNIKRRVDENIDFDVFAQELTYSLGEAKTYPTSAIIESWIKIEEALIKLLENANSVIHKNRVLSIKNRIILLKLGIDLRTIFILTDLRNVRNWANYGNGNQFLPEHSVQYVDIASRLIHKLKQY